MKEKSSIPSPCISVCTVDEDSGFCRGCYRTLAEIANWDHFNDKEKLKILGHLNERRGNANDSGTPSTHC